MNKFWSRDSFGQTLVEAIVVIGIVVLLSTGLIAGTTASLKAARVDREKTEAVKFAQEALETARSIRDNSWDTFTTYRDTNSGQYCMGSNNTLTPQINNNCVGNIVLSDGTYSRSIQFSGSESDPNVTVVTASVGSVDGSLVDPVVLTTYFTQWK
ncbi:MAG TPA: type II secretion system protein [Patescibacteria group bacterium]|nr:type II secretion system protein [Patescibacteria group bacterium]